MPRVTRIALLVLAALVVFATRPPAAAAAGVDIVPFVGVFQPTENQINDLTGGLIANLDSGPAYGVRLDWWFNDRFGLEGSISAASSELLIAGGAALSSSATWFQGDVRARLRLLGENHPVRLDVVGGIGYNDLDYAVKDILNAFEITSDSQTSWVLGLGMDVPVGTMGLRFEAVDNLHDVNFSA